MAYKVVAGSIITGGKAYHKGDSIPLTDEQASSPLFRDRVSFYKGTVSDIEPKKPKAKKKAKAE